ncbi:S8 family peptidase [Crocinitomix catalasitica]|uniref:S8 family peptidase n=1 Tax=Crocinitomix catalasitica TaxID=184607 RepID=UPI0004815CBD|nr:S8 family peptidase [Crocinitomix catalasitica]
MKHLYTLFILLLASPIVLSQNTTWESISLKHYKQKNALLVTDFAVKGQVDKIKSFQGITYKYSADSWHFIRCTPNELTVMIQGGMISQVYFNPAVPKELNDTMRIVQNIDSVHNGNAPLPTALTGAGVVVGYIDSGLDFNHEDFKNDDGTSRVLYYWDHTLAFDEDRTPARYGYGQLWSNADIDAGICTSGDGSAHGTTVTGAGSGNGRATGTHKGVAPDSDIIIVETNFGLANWTLTVADGIDFIFAMADELGKPAVVNTSVGSYLGSHDGTDPASVIIDSILHAKTGRIVVAAAGNSGNQGSYHLKADVDEDTSFCWFDVNMESAFGVPAVYFDLWADTADFRNVNFAFGADLVDPTFEFRARTDFYTIIPLLGTTVYDTIRVGEHNLAPVEFFCEEINGVYHIEMVILNPDSSDYYFRFETFGEGTYDLWSGAWLGASEIVNSGLPDEMDFPDIAHFNLPDSNSTIVSSWTCSPKVVTVGNFKNQYDYIDYAGEPYIVAGGPPGELSPASSKGPNRKGLIKPDVSATGDGIMSACPLWLSASLRESNPSMLAEGGQHVRNGGTSMASPVIAGIAALYLEKCPNASYQDFLNDLHDYSYEDGFTEVTPNNAYGYGKVNAFYMLNQSNFDVTVTGDTLICETPKVFATVEDDFAAYKWFNDATTSSIELDETADVSVIVSDEKGCKAYSDTIHVLKGEIPTFPIINIAGGGLITTAADSFIWYLNDNPIIDSDSQFYNPTVTGNYAVEVFSEDGCSLISDLYFVDYSTIEELSMNEFLIFPNPFTERFNIIKNNQALNSIIISDVSGKLIYQRDDIDENNLFISVDLPNLASGTYILSLYYDQSFKSYRLIKK